MRVGTDYEESEAQSFTVLVAVLVNPTPTATLKLPPPIRTSPPKESNVAPSRFAQQLSQRIIPIGFLRKIFATIRRRNFNLM